jgi:hypothetical protein
MDLGSMLDKIKGYDEILEAHNFKKDGAGDKPWSIRYVNEKSYIEIRNSEWTYNRNNMREWTGETPAELKRLLLEFMSKKELIDMLM